MAIHEAVFELNGLKVVLRRGLLKSGLVVGSGSVHSTKEKEVRKDRDRGGVGKLSSAATEVHCQWGWDKTETLRE